MTLKCFNNFKFFNLKWTNRSGIMTILKQQNGKKNKNIGWTIKQKK